MNKTKQCSNCSRWKEPLSTSACNLEPSIKQHELIPTGNRYYWCLDFELKQQGE